MKAKKKTKKIPRKRPVKKAVKKRVFKVLAKKRNAKKTHEIESEPKKAVIANPEIHKTKIRIIGIGGGGGSIVSEIANRVKKVDFIVANTDEKSLKEISKKAKKFHFGQLVTKGLGTGMNAQIGEQAALQDKEKIRKMLEGQDLCVFVACLGGGTGSGALSIFSKIARSLGCLTYGIFTLPFQFEGERKMEQARVALEKARPNFHAFSIIPNERIFRIIAKETPLRNALSEINKRLADNLEGLIEMIYSPGIINIDFADLNAVLSGSLGKLAYLNTINIEGDKVQEAVERVISTPLYPYTLKGARGILYNIGGGKELQLFEVSNISEIIHRSVNKQAKIIFGISQNQKQKNKINLTILATGCAQKVPETIQEVKKILETKEKAITQERKPMDQKMQNKKPAKKTAKKIKAVKRKIKKRVKKRALTPGATSNIPIHVAEEPKLEETIRRNALEVKRVVQEQENEILQKESVWEAPAIFRKKNVAN